MPLTQFQTTNAKPCKLSAGDGLTLLVQPKWREALTIALLFRQQGEDAVHRHVSCRLSLSLSLSLGGSLQTRRLA